MRKYPPIWSVTPPLGWPPQPQPNCAIWARDQAVSLAGVISAWCWGGAVGVVRGSGAGMETFSILSRIVQHTLVTPDQCCADLAAVLGWLACARVCGLSPSSRGRGAGPAAATPPPGRERTSGPGAHDRIERPARCRVVDVALNEFHLRQAALLSPELGPGWGFRRAVNADDVSLRSNRVGRHESHIPRAAAHIEHPHARLDTGRGEDHPRGRGERTALEFQARQLILGAAKLVAGVAVSHRIPLHARDEYPVGSPCRHITPCACWPPSWPRPSGDR